VKARRHYQRGWIAFHPSDPAPALPRRFIPLLIALLVVSAAFVGTASAAPKSDHVPPGNKGTVKIDDETFNGIPDNDPHEGCSFHLQFFFFPRATTATYSFALIPPTKGDSTGGSVALDPSSKPNADIVVDLTSFVTSSGVDPQPQQGYHLKLTIHAPGAQGADVKHKVFWVKCAATTPPGPPPGTPPGTPPTVAGTRIVHSKGTHVLGVKLAKTGASPAKDFAVAGVLFMAAGMFLVWIAADREEFAAVPSSGRSWVIDRGARKIVGRDRDAPRGSPPRGPPRRSKKRAGNPARFFVMGDNSHLSHR